MMQWFYFAVEVVAWFAAIVILLFGFAALGYGQLGSPPEDGGE